MKSVVLILALLQATMLLPILSCSIFNEPNPEQIITCACDTTCGCDSDCDCDPDCGADCSCDTTTTCEFKCDCDPECRQLGCACDCDEKSGECDDELCRCDGDCTP